MIKMIQKYEDKTTLTKSGSQRDPSDRYPPRDV